MRKIWIVLLFFVPPSLSCQDQDINFNDLYKFNFSLGIEYQTLSPFGDYGTDYNMFYDISAVARLPMPFLPSLQACLQGGMIQFIAPERDNQIKWEHTHWYGLLGAGYSNRFSKNFEIGAEIGAGFSEAIFPSLDPAEVRGSPAFLASAGVRISLNPSYNMSIDVHPSLKYFHYLTPLDRFNGPVFGIGFSLHYRFGEDPDAPQALIRSIRMGETSIPTVFAAMQSYYVKNPLGTVTITNIEDFPVTDIEVSFFQKGFMDSPTKLTSIPELAAGETREIPVTASFNREVFYTEGITPLTGEIQVSYESRRKATEQTFPVVYDLHDKTALTWDDDRKVGAFITPADSALRNFSSFIRQSVKDEVVAGFSKEMQIGMQVFYGLKEIGCLYQVDPTSAFTEVQENPLMVDSISLPRNTLKRLTGDCDDLTVLYNSLMETVGIDTAFITVPGHIFSAFNTKVPSRYYSQVHPDKDMTISIDGELWIPVEITMIGTDDFLSAWRTGVEEFKALDGNPEARKVYFTKKAQEVFRPVGLRETDLGLQYGSSAEIVAYFKSSIDKLIDVVIDEYERLADESGKERNYNKLGIICAQYGRYAEAQKAFNTALSLDRDYIDPIINLGNVFFLKEEFQNALRSYHGAQDRLVEFGREDSRLFATVLLNLSKTYYEIENYDRAAEYFAELKALDPDLVKDFAYLAAGADGGRAAEVSAGPGILFAGEGE